MFRLFRKPAIWLAGLLVWSGLLWFLSSMHGSGEELPIDHLDKLLHFTYFLGGGILLAGFLFFRGTGPRPWKPLVMTVVVAMAVIGALDEWHQCFTPGRSGADPWDWLADVMGAAAGAFCLKMACRRLH